MKLVEDHEVKGKNIHDANIVAVMKANKIEAICTNNVADFKRFSDIKTISL